MSTRRGGGAPVVTWHEADGAPGGFWNRLTEIGFLPEHPRLVVQVGSGRPSRLTWETLHDLARHYARHRPETRVQVLAPPWAPVDWSALAAEPIATDEVVVVEGLAAAELAVPRLWFESFALITLVEPRPDARRSLHAVLAAQAEPLRRAGNRHPAGALAIEAHRLAPSDLAVACGRHAGDAAWWAASASDVSVECALAAACGLAPDGMPALRALARYEVLRPGDVLGRPLPRTGLPLAARLLPPLVGAGERVWSGAVRLARDARAVRRNLHRVPHALRRRLAARGRGGA